MRGHEQILKLRSQGLKPSSMVYLDDYPVKPVFMDWLQHRSIPTVCVHGDEISTLDLRFLIGLDVCVTGDDVTRVRKLAGLSKIAGAVFVYASAGKFAAIWKKGDEKWLTF